MPGIKQITIYQKGDSHIVDLGEINVLVSKTEVPVDQKFIEAICQEIKKITREAGRQAREKAFETSKSSVLSDLKKTGQLLFNHLFPEDIQEILRKADPSDLYLRLDENLLHIPWELCHDGEDFLTLKFNLGRQVLTGQRPRQDPDRSSAETTSLLIILDPSETLPYAQREAEELCSVLDENTQINAQIIGGRQAEKFKLLKALEGQDLVHFIGHSVYRQGPSKDTGWLLKEGLLKAEEISRLNRPPAVVFSNSCHSLATGEASAPTFDEKSLGVGGGFMMAGVGNFIGTSGMISDQGSVQFAVRFYWELTAGRPLGEALQEAKMNVIRTEGKNNLLWASYLLYGDPGYHLGLQIAPTRPPEPPKPSKPPKPPEQPELPKAPRAEQETAPFPLPIGSYDLPSHRVRNALSLVLVLFSLAGLGYMVIPPLFHPTRGIGNTTWIKEAFPVAGPWGWKKGYYTILSDEWDGRALSFLTRQPLTDFMVEMQVQSGQAAWPDAGFGIMIRSPDASKTLVFYISGEGASWLFGENGQRQSLARVQDISISDGSRLAVRARNGLYEASVNGVPVLAVQQHPFSANIGLVVESRWAKTPGFKDMKVEKK